MIFTFPESLTIATVLHYPVVALEVKRGMVFDTATGLERTMQSEGRRGYGSFERLLVSQSVV